MGEGVGHAIGHDQDEKPEGEKRKHEPRHDALNMGKRRATPLARLASEMVAV
jgi:hypothetical protein